MKKNNLIKDAILMGSLLAGSLSTVHVYASDIFQLRLNPIEVVYNDATHTAYATPMRRFLSGYIDLEDFRCRSTSIVGPAPSWWHPEASYLNNVGATFRYPSISAAIAARDISLYFYLVGESGSLSLPCNPGIRTTTAAETDFPLYSEFFREVCKSSPEATTSSFRTLYEIPLEYNGQLNAPSPSSTTALTWFTLAATPTTLRFNISCENMPIVSDVSSTELEKKEETQDYKKEEQKQILDPWTDPYNKK